MLSVSSFFLEEFHGGITYNTFLLRAMLLT